MISLLPQHCRRQQRGDPHSACFASGSAAWAVTGSGQGTRNIFSMVKNLPSQTGRWHAQNIFSMIKNLPNSTGRWNALGTFCPVRNGRIDQQDWENIFYMVKNIAVPTGHPSAHPSSTGMHHLQKA